LGADAPAIILPLNAAMLAECGFLDARIEIQSVFLGQQKELVLVIFTSA
jgi:hypothetical protein